MATIWKGAVNFGLINVPVKLLSAHTTEGVSFRTLHKECGYPVQQKRFCSHCNTEVQYEDTVKGYPLERDVFVPITTAEIKAIPVASTKYIQILDFIKLSEIDPIYFKKAYFLAPEAAGEKPYLILHKAMKDTKSVAVSTITIRDKEHLCVVRAFEGILMLNTMFFSQELKPVAAVNMEAVSKRVKLSDPEIKMAKQIVENLTAPFKPEKYEDNYSKELLALVKAKAEGGEVKRAPSAPLPAMDGEDLFERLKATLAATSRGETPAPPS